MLQKLRVVLVSMMMFLLFTLYCLADDTSMGRTPEGVYPIDNDDVEMVDELVNVYLQEGKVECIFTFKNTGEDNTVLMGFPATLDETYIHEAPGEAEDSIITDFKAFDGEEELLVKLENEVNVSLNDSNKKSWYDKWYTFEVNFKAGEIKTIKNTYRYKAPVGAVGPGLILTGYVLDTGAAWKDNIGHAKVVFHLKDISFTRIDSFYPFDITTLTLEEDKLIFEKSDFEPKFNLELNYWLDPGNLDEDESFYEYLNYDRHMRKNRFFQLTGSSDKDRYFKEAAIKGNSIEILYLLNKISRSMYESASPEIGELLINHDRVLDISVIDLTGDLKSVKYEICSLENPSEILYREEQKIEKNSIEGFGVKNTFSPWVYKEKTSIKLRISAVDYKNNIMEYETDIYFNGDSNEVQKTSKELKENNDNGYNPTEETNLENTDIATDSVETLKESDNEYVKMEKAQGNNSIEFILYTLIGLLVVICIIQQIRIRKFK